MTGTGRLSPPAGSGLFANIGRWLALALVSLGGLFLFLVSATFAFIVLGVIIMVALVAVGIFWLRAKLTGRPFGPRAQMEAHMAELRRQMEAGGASGFGSMRPDGKTSTGPIIDLEETPQGWTVER